MTLPAQKDVCEVLVTVGVDTHLDEHVAVALDQLGRHLDTLSVPTTEIGYAKLLGWAERLGHLEQVGIEGAGSFGAGLSRFLRERSVEVLEVGRPKRRDQHRSGKSDPIDALLAARAVLAGTAIGEPKGGEGLVCSGTDVVRSMAERAGATITEAEGSHVIMVSWPQFVADVILTVVAAALQNKSKRS